jgi:hypothetical protein
MFVSEQIHSYGVIVASRFGGFSRSLELADLYHSNLKVTKNCVSIKETNKTFSLKNETPSIRLCLIAISMSRRVRLMNSCEGIQ